jgi:8-oxo-dGTP pyrophosphatase MutT (NUDIX family)
MDSLSALDPLAWDPEFFKEHPAYAAGQALGCLYQGNKQAATSYPLSGRLYLSKSGWLLLSVPNALVRGVYDAMTAPGAELPIGAHAEVLNAHITVMTGDEVTKVGADKINERGHMFGYTLGALKEIEPRSGSQLSKVWAIQVSAPLLSALRKSYGLSALPNDDEPFHITVAVRKRGVLLDNGVAKGYETPTEVTDGESFEHPISRGELKAAKDESTTYDCSCSGQCMCPDTCVCKKTGCGSHKSAEEMPWRERVEVYTKHPRTGKIYGGVWSGDKSFAVPGGGIDPGETPEQAAVRELAEETGLHAANPVRLPIDPIDQPWSDKTRAEKAKIGRGNFAGSRTHFVMADYVKKMQQDKLDKWDALHRKFYTPDAALALMQDKQFGSPAVAAGRMAALRHLIANAAVNKTAAEDLLHGGKADHMPDSKFSPKALDEGKEDEREHTDNDQIAEEIAKDHLQGDPQYYKKEKLIEQLPAKIASVYMQQLKNLASFREPIVYDESKPVYQNVVDHLSKAKKRGDHILRGRQNMHAYKTMLDPNYRHQMAMQAIHGTSPQMDPLDKTMQLYGNDIFDTIRNWGKKNG